MRYEPGTGFADNGLPHEVVARNEPNVSLGNFIRCLQ